MTCLEQYSRITSKLIPLFIHRFLEEIDNRLEDNLRHRLLRMAKRRKPDERPSLPPHLQRLRAQAAQRGTTLRFMPIFFSSHRDNSTRYHFKEGIIRLVLRTFTPHCGD